MADKTSQRVVIIEDDAGTLNLLQQIVERAGYTPLPARRGQDGLRLVQEGGTDLILLDLMMRDMDGWTVLMAVKSDPRLQAIPVLIVSAKAPPKVDAYAGLYTDYITKPFDVDELILRIGEILSVKPKDPPPRPKSVGNAPAASLLHGTRNTEAVFELALTSEIAARNLYRGLAAKFAHVPAVAQFWQGMMHDEEAHAEQLERLRVSLTAEQLAAPAQSSLWRQATASYELATHISNDAVQTLDDAYQVAQRLESSEINAVFELLMVRYLAMEHKEEIILSQIRNHTSKMLTFSQLFGEAPTRRQVAAQG
jgi:DNA-binding response OmpR family regulator